VEWAQSAPAGGDEVQEKQQESFGLLAHAGDPVVIDDAIATINCVGLE